MLVPVLEPPIRLFNEIVIDQSRTSVKFDLRPFKGCAIHFKWAGTAVGSLKIETAVDPDFGFSQLPEATKTISGASGMDQFEFNGLNGYFIRIVYTHTSGTGTLSAIVGAKTF